jgi:hypothetical protein
MAPRIDVIMSKDVEEFIAELRHVDDEPYLVPLQSWRLHISENARCNANLPPFIVAGTHVITDSYKFRELAQKIRQSAPEISTFAYKYWRDVGSSQIRREKTAA